MRARARRSLASLGLMAHLALPEALMPIAALELRPHSVVGVSRSPFTGTSQTYVWPGQWWEASVTLPPMPWSQAKVWAAFLTALNGPEHTFSLRIDTSLPNTGTAFGHGTWVATTAQSGSSTLPLHNPSATNQAGVAAVGDFLQIAGGTLHQVTSVTTDPATGKMTAVGIFPRVRRPTASPCAMAFGPPISGTFRLSTLPSYAYGPSRIMDGLTLELIEAAYL